MVDGRWSSTSTGTIGSTWSRTCTGSMGSTVSTRTRIIVSKRASGRNKDLAVLPAFEEAVAAASSVEDPSGDPQ